MSQKKATLKDIAEKLNITVATVSRALSNHPDISQKMKDQVKLIAEALNYRPNTYALHLRKQKSGTIGVILPKIIHYYSTTMISGILNTAHKAGYQVLLCDSGSTIDEEKNNARALLQTGVDGLLVSLSNNNGSEELYASLMNDGIPIVFFDKVPTTFSATKISTNDYTGAFMATEHLIQQGYRNIAHIKGQKSSSNSTPRLKGYQAALNKHGLKSNNSLIKECDFCSEEEGYHLTLALMKSKKRPDAIFCINDETAIGAIAALHHLSINIPTEVGIVGFSNSIVGQFTVPALTSVDQFGITIGARATDELLLLINNELSVDASYKQIITEPQLVYRASTNRIINKANA